MKVVAKYYREIEYVLVSELPEAQQELLKQFSEADYIKILADGKIIGPCIQYKQYNDWYNAIYAPLIKQKQTLHALPVKDLAWNKH